MIDLIVRFVCWLAARCRRQSLLESLGTVPAHTQSRFSRDGESL